MSSDASWSVPLVIKLDSSSGVFRTTPTSNMLLCAGPLPSLILQVSSHSEGKDEIQMRLQAAALARLGGNLCWHGHFVVAAIYVDNLFVANRYLFSLLDREKDAVSLDMLSFARSCSLTLTHAHIAQVVYTKEQFRLDDPHESFKFLFELYNMGTLAKEQGSKISPKRLQDMLDCAMALPVMKARPKKHLRSSELWDDPEIDDLNEAVTAAGYTLDFLHLPQEGKDVFKRFYYVSDFLSAPNPFVTFVAGRPPPRSKDKGRALRYYQADQTLRRD